MNKKLLIPSLVIFAIASYENIYAHGIGGGDRSYKYDKKDNTADQEARKKAAEEQEARENWDDFMRTIKSQETKTNKETGQSGSSSQ